MVGLATIHYTHSRLSRPNPICPSPILCAGRPGYVTGTEAKAPSLRTAAHMCQDPCSISCH